VPEQRWPGQRRWKKASDRWELNTKINSGAAALVKEHVRLAAGV